MAKLPEPNLVQYCTFVNPDTQVACRKVATEGYTRCWEHGGGNSAFRRPLNPDVAPGKADTVKKRRASRYSAAFKSETLRTRFEELLNNPAMLDLREELALQHMMMESVAAKVKAIDLEKIPAEAIALVNQTVGEISKTTETIAKLEGKLQTIIRIEDLRSWTDEVLNIVVKYIDDPAKLESLAIDLNNARVPASTGRRREPSQD